MRRLYTLLITLLAPLAFAIVLARGCRDRGYWQGLRERFGYGPALADGADESPQRALWLHAVSLGEVSAAATLVRALRARYPETPFVLTTATPTGRARARELFGAAVDVRFLPYDTPGALRRFFTRVRPRLLVIMETEIWPNLLHACATRAVPVVFASARLRPKSLARYVRFRGLFRAALARNCSVAAQTPEDAERFIAIGADRSRTDVIGNLKFDLDIDKSMVQSGHELRRAMFGPRAVWIAGSTHAGEDEQVLDAHAAVCGMVRETLLVLVPRHPQRFESVAGLLARRGIAFDRRSAAGAVRPEAQVLLVDSIGELGMLYAAADVAFVGGSLVPVGGHNLLEPAAVGVPVVTGVYNANAADIARLLIAAGGAVQVADALELAAVVGGFLADPAQRARAGAAAMEFVARHRGSVQRLVGIISSLWPGAAPGARP